MAYEFDLTGESRILDSFGRSKEPAGRYIDIRDIRIGCKQVLGNVVCLFRFILVLEFSDNFHFRVFVKNVPRALNKVIAVNIF
jgi:hypothetical protein